jgi:hypothetical protein
VSTLRSAVATRDAMTSRTGCVLSRCSRIGYMSFEGLCRWLDVQASPLISAILTLMTGENAAKRDSVPCCTVRAAGRGDRSQTAAAWRRV